VVSYGGELWKNSYLSFNNLAPELLTGISVCITADNGDTEDALRFADQKPLASSVLKKSANPPDNRAETLVVKPTEVYHIIDNWKLFKLDHGVGCAYC
jgi:hypothetical protein